MAFSVPGLILCLYASFLYYSGAVSRQATLTMYPGHNISRAITNVVEYMPEINVDNLKIYNVSDLRTQQKTNLPQPLLLNNEPNICHLIRPESLLLIYVHSAPSHFRQRAHIRETHSRLNLYKLTGATTLFFMGRSSDKEVERAVRLEIDWYHDIIRGDYQDDIRNVAVYKDFSAIAWMTTYCPKIPYTLKMSDTDNQSVYSVLEQLKSLKEKVI